MCFWSIIRTIFGPCCEQVRDRTKLDQVKTLSKIKVPRTVRDVQSLVGKVVALSRFISKMSNMCKPFFWNIEKSMTLERGEE